MKWKNSFKSAVVEAIRARGPCTIDDIQPLFLTVHRGQLDKAIDNARANGEIVCLRRGIGGHRPAPGLWATPDHKPGDPYPSVNSVWELARPERKALPLKESGRQVSPLGDWGDVV